MRSIPRSRQVWVLRTEWRLEWIWCPPGKRNYPRERESGGKQGWPKDHGPVQNHGEPPRWAAEPQGWVEWKPSPAALRSPRALRLAELEGNAGRALALWQGKWDSEAAVALEMRDRWQMPHGRPWLCPQALAREDEFGGLPEYPVDCLNSGNTFFY